MAYVSAALENIFVIDRTRALHQVGQAIDLLPNGLKALIFAAYEAVKQVGMRASSPLKAIV